MRRTSFVRERRFCVEARLLRLLRRNLPGNRAASRVLSALLVSLRTLAFRLPVEGEPRALFETDWLFHGGRLLLDGRPVVEARTRDELKEGVQADFAEGTVTVTLVERDGSDDLEIRVGDALAVNEATVALPATRSAWIHAWIALCGSFAGFVSSALYLHKASILHSEWALKMGQHTLAWHLVLTLTLFPASVWGQRLGIRIVQVVSAVFFAIHVGIALANVGHGGDASNPNDAWIALGNAISGVAFLAAVLWGQRAARDMDPRRRARLITVTPAASTSTSGASPDTR